MPTCVILGKLTEQGARNIKESPKREEAPDDVTMSAILYSIGSLGNVRTATLRAFTQQETEAALSRVA